MFFVKTSRFFQQKKPLLHTLLIVSSVLFIFWGFKIQYQKDLSEQIPSSESSASCLFLGNLNVKDKIFIQMTGAEPEIMIGYVNELMGSTLVNGHLFSQDSTVALIAPQCHESTCHKKKI